MIAPVNTVASEDPNNHRVVHPIVSPPPAQFGAVRDSFANSQWVTRAPRWWENWFGLSGKPAVYQSSGSSSSSAGAWILGLLVTVGVGGLLTHHFRTKASSSSSSGRSPGRLPQSGKGAGAAVEEEEGIVSPPPSRSKSSQGTSLPPPIIDPKKESTVQSLSTKMKQVKPKSKFDWAEFDILFPYMASKKNSITADIVAHIKTNTPQSKILQQAQEIASKEFFETLGVTCSNGPTGTTLAITDWAKWDGKRLTYHPKHLSVMLESFNQLGNKKLADALITLLLTDSRVVKEDAAALNNWKAAYRAAGRTDAINVNGLNPSGPTLSVGVIGTGSPVFPRNKIKAGNGSIAHTEAWLKNPLHAKFIQDYTAGLADKDIHAVGFYVKNEDHYHFSNTYWCPNKFSIYNMSSLPRTSPFYGLKVHKSETLFQLQKLLDENDSTKLAADVTLKQFNDLKDVLEKAGGFDMPKETNKFLAGKGRDAAWYKRWDDRSIGAMRVALRSKFESPGNSTLLTSLRDTKTAILVESTENDYVWASGSHQKIDATKNKRHPVTKQQGALEPSVGLNLLGKLLMELRDGYDNPAGHAILQNYIKFDYS